MGFNKLLYLVTLYFLMYYLLMPSKYTKDLTNILEMLWNIENTYTVIDTFIKCFIEIRNFNFQELN